MDLENLDRAFTGEQVTVTEVVAALIVLAVGIGVAYLVGRIAEKRFGRPDYHAEQVVKIWHDSRISSGNVAIDQAVRTIKPALEAAGTRLAPSLELVVDTKLTP